ncbi:MAG: hypothetical protein WCH84_11060 [Verrucomicrobiota bacterium]
MKFEPPILLKRFCLDEAQRLECSTSNIYHRISHGGYRLRLLRVNRRVVFVCSAEERITAPLRRPGEISMKDFLAAESERSGLSRSGVAMRISRGMYRHLKLRRINRRVVFVKL